jgi:hypothetical protein
VKGPQQKLRTHRSLKAYCASIVMKMKEKIIRFLIFLVMEQRWDEIDKGKPTYLGKNLSQYHFVHQKSHMHASKI